MARTAHNERQHQAMTFPQFGIRANVDTHVLSTVTFEKTISSNMNKRRYLPQLGWSVPLGYQLPWTTDEDIARVFGNDDSFYNHYLWFYTLDRSFNSNDLADQENNTPFIN
ncbi:hypothetical protein HDE_08673 [Halotydeus destructor]|nr:hypothetical protein HDE_08673 [Halotydeus destructor]